MTHRLSESLEDYLEAIAELIAVEGHAHTKEIAEKLNVKMPSVTGALRQLERLNYIVYNTHYPVMLTPEGKAAAEQVMLRHRVLKRFFSDILGLPLDKASDTACRLEHVVDEDTIRRFMLFSEAISSRSDARSLQTYLTEAMTHLSDEELCDSTVLTSLAPGTRFAVMKFGRNLNSADCSGISVGDVLTLEGISLDRSAFRVSGGDVSDIPLAVAENLYVKVCSSDAR